jgi:dolichol-phosphate mannosyltransferase
MSYELVSVILPVYNQADHIANIVDSYVNVLEKIPLAYEILLVVNNSRDDSLSLSQQLAEKNPAIRVLHSEAGGWGLAVKLGLKAAQGDLVCYTNSARTSAPNLQLMILYAIANPGNVIKANRKLRESFSRRLGSLLYNLECRNLFDLPYWDINGTPKLFPKAYDQFFTLSEDGDLIDLEFNAVCRENNYAMLEIPIISTTRHGGKSTTSLKSAWRMYAGAFQLWRKRRA